eukprot:6191669-Pleurochrysis_carterae.AAC.1
MSAKRSGAPSTGFKTSAIRRARLILKIKRAAVRRAVPSDVTLVVLSFNGLLVNHNYNSTERCLKI